jgi:hypothetical protein
MITVKQLQEIRSQRLPALIESIEKEIVSRDQLGYTNAVFHLSKPQSALIEDVVTRIKLAGYKVTRSCGCDIRGESWDYLKIQWT